jgi:hypothetical protein
MENNEIIENNQGFEIDYEKIKETNEFFENEAKKRRESFLKHIKLIYGETEES